MCSSDLVSSKRLTGIGVIPGNNQIASSIHEVGNGKRSNICFTNINAYSVGSHEINYLNNTLFSIKLQRSQIGTLLS